MTELLAWGAMVGSWLLVAGPLHQGSTELWEMGRSARGELALTPWDRLLWLTPPILYLVQLARIRRFEAESPEPPPGTHREAFTNRATGWFAVASGGLLIALNETWGLFHSHRWAPALFWLISAAILLLIFVNIGARMDRLQRIEDARPNV